MRQFAELFTVLDQTNKTNDKIALLKQYFQEASDKDKLWTLALFTHKRPKKQVRTALLREWTAELAAVPSWLFEESYSVVGDLAETMALLLPEPAEQQDQPLSYWIAYIRDMENLSDAEKKEKILYAWQQMSRQEKFVFNKLMTSSFRIGVSQNMVIRAISEVHQVDKTVVAHRLMGNWQPDTSSYEGLLLEENKEDNLSRPYPFFLAHALETKDFEAIEDVNDWQIEWKWDGIRSQVIVRGGKLFIWSRGEELLTEKFPELHAFQNFLPDGTVIDGEILPFKNGELLNFAALQTRIGRKNLTKNILKSAPVIIRAYDLLEWQGKDIRQEPLSIRRELLENLHTSLQVQLPFFQLSTLVSPEDKEILKNLRLQSRDYFAEGFMLKRKSSAYQVGRKRGDWWKWKVDPLTIDGVLINAQRGTGRRAGLYTDYTFAVWDREEGKEELVPFTKAYSGLTDAEFRQVDRFIKQNTRERFGPVRTVKPELVFEIAFEGIQESKRHKSGVALRFPRMLRWRHDKKAEDANSLEELKALLDAYGG
ncbi:ATP-dependent DNA ligase [Catalinimonas niigatensis]|uniref:ATP-dependent DNA ligase n=1 Tax=Catalinimonas niigatensis TaxID=1397264 RepID=UPI0026654588|nr:ATP-dependent DNA ligase [Catalinimonas niigatensis]WPP51272.1 ATP-dependent DNA ligase [Catalinimonas niigatensis]